MAPFDWLPFDPVSRGDRWTRKSIIRCGTIGQYRGAIEYTYKGRIDGLYRIATKTSLAFQPASDQSASPFEIKAANLKEAQGSGEISFDVGRGRLVKTDASLTVMGSFTIVTRGMEHDVAYRLSQNQRIRVTDTDPLEKNNKQAEPRP